MSVRTAVRGSLPYAVAIIGGFLLAYLIVAFLVFPSGVIPRDTKVPNVTGLQFDEAVKRLAARGLRGERGEDRFHGAAPNGTVLEQFPAAGARDVEGAAVTLAVSVGQKLIGVPQLVGMTRDEAQTALEAVGLDLGDVAEKPNAAPRGHVIESQPKPGAQVPLPSAVAIVISTGAPAAAAPARPR